MQGTEISAEHPDAPTVRVYRPKPVAQFLRRLPVDCRHDAVNALTMLGLDAFASSGLFNYDTWQSMQVHGDRIVANLRMLAKESEPHLSAHFRSISARTVDELGDDLGEGGLLVSPSGRNNQQNTATSNHSSRVEQALRTESRVISPNRRPQRQQQQPPAAESLLAVGGTPSGRVEGRKHVSPPSPRAEKSPSRRKFVSPPAAAAGRSESVEFSRISPARPQQQTQQVSGGLNYFLAPSAATKRKHSNVAMNPVPVGELVSAAFARSTTRDQPPRTAAVPNYSLRSQQQQQQQQRDTSADVRRRKSRSPHGIENAALVGMASKLRSEAEALLSVARRFEGKPASHLAHQQQRSSSSGGGGAGGFRGTHTSYTRTAMNTDRSAVRSPHRRSNSVDLRDFLNSQRERLKQQRELGNDIDANVIRAPIAVPFSRGSSSKRTSVQSTPRNSIISNNIKDNNVAAAATRDQEQSQQQQPQQSQQSRPTASSSTRDSVANNNSMANSEAGGGSGGGITGQASSSQTPGADSNPVLTNASFGSSVDSPRPKLLRQKKVAVVIGDEDGENGRAVQEVQLGNGPIASEDEDDEEEMRNAVPVGQSPTVGIRARSRADSFWSDDGNVDSDYHSESVHISPPRRSSALDTVFASAWGLNNGNGSARRPVPTLNGGLLSGSLGAMLNASGMTSYSVSGVGSTVHPGPGNGMSNSNNNRNKGISPARGSSGVAIGGGGSGGAAQMDASTGDVRLLPLPNIFFEKSPPTSQFADI